MTNQHQTQSQPKTSDLMFEDTPSNAELVRMVNRVMVVVLKSKGDVEMAQKTADATEMMAELSEREPKYFEDIMTTFLDLAQKPAESDEFIMNLCAYCYCGLHRMDPEKYPI